MANAYKTVFLSDISSSTEEQILTTAASTEKIVKELRFTNTTSSAVSFSCWLETTASPAVHYHLAKDMTIPANSSLNVVDNVLVVEQASPSGAAVLKCQAGTATAIDVVCSYLEIT